MKEYLSPGTYIEQRDQSFLPTTEGRDSTAVFIGGFTKGKAFLPMLIKDGPDLIKKTGQPNGKLYSQYAALEYSKYAGDFWVQRLLWTGGYKSDAVVIYGTTNSAATTGDVLAILASSNTGSADNTLTLELITECTGSSADARLKYEVKGGCAGGDAKVTMSLTRDQILNINQVISSNPYQLQSPVYLYSQMTDTGSLSIYETISIVHSQNLLNFQNSDYKSAVTPWITDEHGSELFRFVHLSDGTYTNKDVKVQIKNITTASNSNPAYTKFDVIVRQYNDTQRRPIVQQAFYDLNLDPQSISYIGKRIGDIYTSYDVTNKKLIIKGDYKNNSNLIRVELGQSVKRNMIGILTNINHCQKIPLWYADADNYEADYPDEYIYTASSSTAGGYDVSKYSIQQLSNPSSGSTIPVGTQLIAFECNNFMMPFYGGFDGKNPSSGYQTDENTLMGFDMTTADSEGVESYKLALDMMINTDEFDIDLISMAGITLESQGKSQVFRYALEDICQERGDCIVIGDLTQTDNRNSEIAQTLMQPFDSSYGAVYFPSVKYYDGYTRTYPVLPVATLIPSVIAYNKKYGLPHYAPAGIDRGTLNVIQATSKLTKAERDTLYKLRVNPIASFAGTGTVVWGQKTLQKAASALDRINVRFSVNQIKKWLDRYGKYVLFNNNTTTLRGVFSLGATTYLDSLVASGGLYEYKFKMDDSNNTPQVIDRNQLVGTLWIKPTKTTEFIVIQLNIVRTDAVL